MSNPVLLIIILAAAALAAAVPTILLRRTVAAVRAEWIEHADRAMSGWVSANVNLLTTRAEVDAVMDFPTDWKTRRARQQWLSDALDQWRQQNLAVHNRLLRSEVSALTDLLEREKTPDGALAWPRQSSVETARTESGWAHLTDESNIRAWQLPPDNHLVIRSEIDSLVAELRRDSQQQAAEVHADLFESLETHPMTANQVEAVTSNESVNLVVAGAGSGKTSVMVARAAWLVASGQAQASEILLLAYNRAAAAELRERLEQHFGSTRRFLNAGSASTRSDYRTAAWRRHGRNGRRRSADWLTRRSC